jgi:hypothetical protein
MPSFDYDFRYLQTAIDQLDSYLLSKEIYLPIGIKPTSDEPPYPQFTLGALLLAKERAQATALSLDQQAKLSELLSQLEAIRSKWRSAWGRKATAEFRARLNLWSNFLNEYRDQPDAHDDRYAYEVSRRVMLELLRPYALDLPDADEQLLDGLDSLLKTVMISGKFIWDDELLKTFPEQLYWYLYGYLPKKLEQEES